MLLAGATANAAKCNFQDDFVNVVSKVRTVQTKWEKLISGLGKAPEGPHEVQAADFSTRFEGGDAFLTIRISLEHYSTYETPQYELENAISIPGNSQLLILMSDGAILRLPVEKELSFDATFVAPGTASNTRFRKTDMNEYVRTTEATISYVLDENTTAQLRAQDATNMRVEAGDTYYDIDIRRKSLGDMAAAIECLQQARAEDGAAQ